MSEGGVAAGTRRIEAVTGRGVLAYVAEKDNLIADTASVLKTNLLNEIDKKAEALANELKNTQKELEALKAQIASAKANDIMSDVKKIGDVELLAARLDGMSADDLKKTADGIKEKLTAGVVVLASNTDDKITFVAMVTKDALGMGAHAGNIIKEITQIAGGRGGGKPDMAQGGGKDASKIDDALAHAESVVESQIK